MSIVASSFLNNSWDIPIRRTGFSLLMSGDIPSHLYAEQTLSPQQQQQKEQEQAEVQRSSSLRGSSAQDQGSPKSCASPHAPTPFSLSASSWARVHQTTLTSASSFMRQQQQDLGTPQQDQLRLLQRHDSGIVQKFSSLSVRMGQPCGADSSRSPVHDQPQDSTVPTGRIELSSSGSLQQEAAFAASSSAFLAASSSQSSGCASGSSGASASASAPQCGAGGSGVFASLDSVDEHSPPSSPAGNSIPWNFCSGRAASFPAYDGRTSASATTLCCCCGAGVCPMCKGVPFPPPLRASASHPIPTRQHSQPATLAALPQGLGRQVQGALVDRFGNATSPTSNSWFYYSQSLPSTGHSTPAASLLNITAGAVEPSGGLSQLGWDMVRSQAAHNPLSLSPQQYQQPPRQQGPVGSPTAAPVGLETSQGGAEAVSAEVAGATLERELANHWGFGVESMESSSLSLSQDCSDSLGGEEMNSAGGDQEVDSVSSTRCTGGYKPTPESPADTRSPSLLGGRTSPISPQSSHGGLQPLAGHLSSPLVPRATSSPMTRRLPPRDSSSLASPGLRHGLSSYFGGKSRSFTSLADVSSIQSIQELAKPVRNYARRKRLSSSKDGSPKSAESRKLALGIGKDPRGLFKKGPTQKSLGFQAGLAVAVAMGELDVDIADAARGIEGEGMETVMEEAGEGVYTDTGLQQPGAV